MTDQQLLLYLGKFIQITDDCHYWRGPAPQQKPIIRDGKKTKSARRVIYELRVHSLTPSEVIIDTCGNSLCMNLDHLQIISRSELACRSLKD
jgi:hypothetical protein